MKERWAMKGKVRKGAIESFLFIRNDRFYGFQWNARRRVKQDPRTSVGGRARCRGLHPPSGSRHQSGKEIAQRAQSVDSLAVCCLHETAD